jgi:tRNA-dihydrouridine synthase
LTTNDIRVAKMEEHLRLLVKFKGEYRGIQEARKHISWYVKGVAGGARLREIINKAETVDDMLVVIEKVKNSMDLYK